MRAVLIATGMLLVSVGSGWAQASRAVTPPKLQTPPTRFATPPTRIVAPPNYGKPVMPPTSSVLRGGSIVSDHGGGFRR